MPTEEKDDFQLPPVVPEEPAEEELEDVDEDDNDGSLPTEKE